MGSSLELVQHLEDTPSSKQRKQLATIKRYPADSSARHVFSINDKDEVQKLWQKIQANAQTPMQVQPQQQYALKEAVQRAGASRSEPRMLQAKPHGVMPDAIEHPSAVLADLENHRVQYFNTTNPPRLGGHNDAGNVTKYEAKEDAASPAANLSMEGKRQAQLAGEKFRARGPSSRHRKMSAGPADRSSYHNRWASYKNTSETTKGFHPMEMAFPRTKSSLTPEGKRQVSRLFQCTTTAL